MAEELIEDAKQEVNKTVQFIFKKCKTFSVLIYSYINTSGN